MSSSPSDVQAVTLLDVHSSPLVVTQQYGGETIPLAKGDTWQVLLAAAPTGAHQAYLIITIGGSQDFELVVHSDHSVEYSRLPHATQFRIEGGDVPGAYVVLSLARSSVRAQESAEELRDVLEQYCGVKEVVMDAGMTGGGKVATRPQLDRGQSLIELEDEEGHVLGTLDPARAPSPAAPGTTTTTGPTSAQQQEKDWLMNGAHGLARGLVSLSDWAGGHMTRAADRYTSRGATDGAASPNRQGYGYGGSPSLNVPGSSKMVEPPGYALDGGAAGGYGDEKKGGASPYSGLDYSGNSGSAAGGYEDASTWRRSPSPLSYNNQQSNSGRSSPRRSNVRVHPSVTKGLTALQSGSGHVVRLSGQARTAILNASEGAGRKLGGIGQGMRDDPSQSAQQQQQGQWQGQGQQSPYGTPQGGSPYMGSSSSGTTTPNNNKKPGAFRTHLARGAQAANVVIDGFDSALTSLVSSAGSSAGQAIEFRFGPEARAASGLAGNVGRNCFLVYKDVSGVRRKILMKVAGGTLQGTTPQGNRVVVRMPEQDQQGSAMGGRAAGGDVDSIESDYRAGAGAGSSSSGGKVEPPRYEDVKRA